MNLLLLVRPEILSILMMIFLICYDRYCARFREGKDYFIPFAWMCLGHDVMALATEITVNTPAVPKPVNDLCHILLFLFSLLYTLKYFEYTLSLVVPNSQIKKYMAVCYGISVVPVVVTLVAPIRYVQGSGTVYSAGIGPSLCYGLGFLMFITADCILIRNRRRVSNSIVYFLLPLSIIALSFLLVQIFVPEFLFTGSALTLTALGMFLAMENPVGKIQEQAFIDYSTQIWNKNCYNQDMKTVIPARAAEGSGIGIVIADINGLKAVNDSLGHLEGDRLIESVASILQDAMKHAFRIYRIGGDEFAAIYLDHSTEEIRFEVTLASERCRQLRVGKPLVVGVCFGIGLREAEEPLSEMISRADQDLYTEKERFYRQNGNGKKEAAGSE